MDLVYYTLNIFNILYSDNCKTAIHQFESVGLRSR